MWYAIYVKSRQEKKVAKLLSEKGIETYVPLKTVIRQWSDRKKRVEEPVISCYVFVKREPSQREAVLHTPGVVAYVRYDKRDAEISEKEINVMKDILGEPDAQVRTVNENLREGQNCIVTGGPLAGKSVILYELKGSRKAGIYIDELKMGLTVDIDPRYLEPLD